MIDNNDAIHVCKRQDRADLIEAKPLAYNATAFLHRNGLVSSVFHVKPTYYQDKSGMWRPLSEITLHHGNHRIVLDARKAWDRCSFSYLQWLAKRQMLLGSELEYAFPYGPYVGVPMHEYATMASLAVSPDPSPETTTVDGQIAIAGQASWAAARDSATGTANDSNSTMFCLSQEDTGGTYYGVQRLIMGFDTSPLTDAATITAATLTLNVSGSTNTDDDGDDYINVYQASPASNTALVDGDFDSLGTTAWATQKDVGTLSGSEVWTLNATGRAAISQTSVTNLGCREGHDVIDSTVQLNTKNSITVSTAESASDPVLTVTYSLPFSAGPMGVF